MSTANVPSRLDGAQAAQVILKAVLAKRRCILIGADIRLLDHIQRLLSGVHPWPLNKLLGAR